jgi:cell division protein FtsW (lipid II flippase)
MALLIGLLTPLVLYGLIVRFGSRRSPSVVALVCAVLALVTAGVTIGRLGPRTRPLQIAWTGIEQHDATRPLTIGGTRDAAVVGWPNGASEPRLQMQKTATAVSLDINGGLAFLIDTNSGQYLNGSLMPLGSTIHTGPYTVRSERAFPGFWRRRITIESAAGKVVSTYAVTTGPGSRGRFAALKNVDGEVKDPLFREYAQSVLLSVDTAGELHVLDTNNTAQTNCAFPCRLLVRWRTSAVRMEVAAAGTDVLSVSFQRPWRYTSPMPPAEAQQHVLVVTGDAEPEDRAFLLPIGGAIGSLRHYVHIDRAGGDPKFVTGQVQSRDDGKTALIPAGSHRFRVSLTEDGLRIGRLLTLLALCLVPLAVASATVPGLDAKRAEAVCAMALVAWTLLLVRVLLAVRYALSPAHLDQMGIGGLASSIFGLAIVPALILLAARIRHDVTNRVRRFGSPLLTVGVTAVVAALQMWMVPTVWRDLPALMIPAMCRPWFIATSGLLGVLFTALAVLGAHVSRGPFRLLAIPNYYAAATRIAGGFWNALNAGTGRKIAVVILSVAALGFVFFGIVPFVLSMLPAQKLAQEVIFPLLFLWLATVLWTTSTANAAGTSKRAKVLLVVWMIAVFLFPWFLFPLAMRDAGNLYATTAVFLPLALLLLPFRGSRFAGVTVLSMFIAVVACSVLFYLNVDAIYRLNRFYLRDVSGAATTRLLVFKKGLDLRTDTAGQTHSLRNAVQHVWENQAMARRGGLSGRGYGEAPVRRSRIPQEVLQFDSIHSFYITGDFGLIGGLSAILAYLFPLIFLLSVASRHGLTRGLLFAIVVSSAFALEGISHAAMNLGALPFSGRSAPLLAATSGSDLLKWGVLLLIAGTALFDTTTITPTFGRMRTVAFLALLLPVGLTAWTATRAIRIAYEESLDAPFTWAPALRALQEDVRAGKLSVVVDAGGNYMIDGGATVSSVDLSWLQEEIDYFNSLPPDMKVDPPAAAVALAQATRVRDLPTYDQWLRDSTLQRVPSALRKESIFRLVDTDVTYDEAGEISNPSAPAKQVEINFRTDSPYSFARDNRRPEDIPTISLRGPAENLWMIQGGDWAVTVPAVQARPMSSRSILLRPRAGSLVLSRDAAPELPNGSIAVWLTNRRTRRPFEKRTLDFDLFNGNLRISNPPGGFRDFRVVRDGQPRQIAPGTAFVLAEGDVIEIAMPVEFTASIISRKTSPIIGPAWINGHWRAASNDSGIVPWSHQLAQAIDSEWERLGPAAAASRYAELTLDSSLQRSSQTNAAREGRQLHAAKIGRRNTNATSILPPRAAFAALAIPSGEVLAVGGWPRMSPQRFGERGAGREWLPGYDWVDRDAPSQIRVRYDSDRNFDLLLMGSSTKPLFAAAALKVHPSLNNLLRVQPARGEGDRESHVFGFDVIDPAKGWKVSPSGIVDFNQYLAISDNRYHVRLGFMALAEADGNGFAHTGQRSPSTEELVGVNNQGQPLIWGRYPRFPAGLSFSNTNPRQIANLEQTPFSAGMRTMFGIAAKSGDFGSHRLSFWTGDGAHDVFAPGNDTPSASLRGISPRIANLNLNAITVPRAWVSTLLGGESNRWSNVDFAAAFATAITGRQVLPHITGQNTIRFAPDRETFPAIARRIRPGLEASISDSAGTAHLLTRNTDPARVRDCGQPALAGLQSAVPGLRAYAKTGTLSSTGLRAHTTSRIALALIRWANEAEGQVQRGMIVSIVLEEASPGTATCVVNRYLNENADAIIRTLTR